VEDTSGVLASTKNTEVDVVVMCDWGSVTRSGPGRSAPGRETTMKFASVITRG
jgi:hypothetical protein